MNLHFTAEDNMNLIATDIIVCPECDSEEIKVMGVDHSHIDDDTILIIKCGDCERLFKTAI